MNILKILSILSLMSIKNYIEYLGHYASTKLLRQLMVQKIFFNGSGSTGIVGTLIISGIVLETLGISPEWANAAIGGGVCIGILLGLLGVAGVFTKVFR